MCLCKSCWCGVCSVLMSIWCTACSCSAIIKTFLRNVSQLSACPAHQFTSHNLLFPLAGWGVGWPAFKSEFEWTCIKHYFKVWGLSTFIFWIFVWPNGFLKFIFFIFTIFQYSRTFLHLLGLENLKSQLQCRCFLYQQISEIRSPSLLLAWSAVSWLCITTCSCEW